jgi:hypothetical protein
MNFWRENKRFQEFRGSLKQQQIYDQKFQDLITNGTVVETDYKDLVWISPSNLVPKAGGDMRLVIDMRAVNKFMKHTHFKMEGIPTVRDILERQDYGISFDLKKHTTMFRYTRRCNLCWGFAGEGSVTGS